MTHTHSDFKKGHNITVVQLLVIPNIIRKAGYIHEFSVTLTSLPPVCVKGRTNSHTGVPRSSSSGLCEVISLYQAQGPLNVSPLQNICHINILFVLFISAFLCRPRRKATWLKIAWSKGTDIKIDKVQLPAEPSLLLVSGIPYLSCWKLTNQK